MVRQGDAETATGDARAQVFEMVGLPPMTPSPTGVPCWPIVTVHLPRLVCANQQLLPLANQDTKERGDFVASTSGPISFRLVCAS